MLTCLTYLNEFRISIGNDAIVPPTSGYQAAQKVVSAGAEESLSVLAKYSQNLPSLARSLSRTVVKPELKTEVKHVMQLNFDRFEYNEGAVVAIVKLPKFVLEMILMDKIKAIRDKYCLFPSESERTRTIRSPAWTQCSTAERNVDRLGECRPFHVGLI